MPPFVGVSEFNQDDIGKVVAEFGLVNFDCDGLVVSEKVVAPRGVLAGEVA